MTSATSARHEGRHGAALRRIFGMPMHPGAENYYREAGLLK